MCLPWFCYRWYRRCQILAILVYRYFSPWDPYFQHPIVFEIWGLAMDFEMIAEQMDLESACTGDSGDENDSTLLEDGSPVVKLIETLAGAERRGLMPKSVLSLLVLEMLG